MTGEFPAQRASNAENVSIWWCHHALPKIIDQHCLCYLVFCIIHPYPSWLLTLAIIERPNIGKNWTNISRTLLLKICQFLKNAINTVFHGTRSILVNSSAKCQFFISQITSYNNDVFQCWKFPQVRRSEADNFGGGPGNFCWFFFNFMFMIWDSRYEDLQLFWLSFKHWCLSVLSSYIPSPLATESFLRTWCIYNQLAESHITYITDIYIYIYPFITAKQ